MFSKKYLQVPAGQTDSTRLRNRWAAVAVDLMDGSASKAFALSVRANTGAEFPSQLGGFLDIASFFRKAEMRDLLDAITCAITAINVRSGGKGRSQWIVFCQTAFREEGTAYDVDEDGAVHYRVDVAFHETADSAIAALSVARFAAPADAIRKSIAQLTAAHSDEKSAVRDVYEAVESTFKIVTSSNKDLSQQNIAALLTPIVNARFETDPFAKGAATQMLDSLKDWANACQKYRHGQNAPDLPVPLVIWR